MNEKIQLTKTKEREGVQSMFDSIAKRYDFLNHFLSFGIDILWRKILIKNLMSASPEQLLDVATGSADLAIMAAKKGVKQIHGIDLSAEMLAVAETKVEKLGLKEQISLVQGDALQLPYSDLFFDAVMIAFGIRNFQNTVAGLREMYRVMKPGAKLFILEFSQPRCFPVKQLYTFYSKHALPIMGSIFGGNRKAYSYLYTTAQEFPAGDAFLALLSEAEFIQMRAKRLSFGIATLYIAEK